MDAEYSADVPVESSCPAVALARGPIGRSRSGAICAQKRAFYRHDVLPVAPAEAIEKIAGYTEHFCKFMEGLAVSYNINIIGGSHPTKMKNGEIHNICYVFLRDGVAADTAPNTETIALADLSLDDLLTGRQHGTVRNLKDRRFDLYRVNWRKG